MENFTLRGGGRPVRDIFHTFRPSVELSTLLFSIFRCEASLLVGVSVHKSYEILNKDSANKYYVFMSYIMFGGFLIQFYIIRMYFEML